MKKKGWNPNEIDIPYIVSVHNTVNQRVWSEVMKYERYHLDQCATPKLLRFQGRPTDLSPKAHVLSTVGYNPPFDRHDWYVDRCGTDVRYIIDFYDGARHPTLPASTHIDARPALDSVGAAWDRVRSWVETKFFSN
jgi:cytochrome c heme-lyase